MSTHMKTIFRIYAAWAADEEAEWLNRMARQGWQLHDVQFMMYRFLPAEESNHVYQLDYQELPREKWLDYVGLLAEAGWEYVTSITNWHYFRGDGNREDLQPLHTDNASKIQQVKRLRQILLFTCWTPIFWALYYPFVANLRQYFGVGFWLVEGFTLLVALLMVYSFIRLTRLKRTLQNEPKE